jgi:4-amino-4-deoxy-L-arabinose transferase-like glycosyltransferase
MLDVALVFFVLASIYFLVLSDKRECANRYAALGGLFFGLAFMTKQVAAFLIPIVVFVYFAATERSIRFLFTKRFAIFLGVGILVFSPWLIYMILSFGSDFWQPFFVFSGITRASTPIEGHVEDCLFYFRYLADSENLFWMILLPFSAGLCTFNAVIKRSKADTLIIAWMSIMLVLFTLAQTKIYWYILPAFPAFAIAISNFLYQLSKKIRLAIRLLGSQVLRIVEIATSKRQR